MQITFISPFVDLLKKFTSVSILNRAKKKGLVNYNYLDLFLFSKDTNNKIDDHL